MILNSLFAWLVNAGYLAGNPLSLTRERKRRTAPRVTRYLDEDIWPEVKATVDTLPRDTAREREHYFRMRWLISLFYICGLRDRLAVVDRIFDPFIGQAKALLSDVHAQHAGQSDRRPSRSADLGIERLDQLLQFAPGSGAVDLGEEAARRVSFFLAAYSRSEKLLCMIDWSMMNVPLLSQVGRAGETATDE